MSLEKNFDHLKYESEIYKKSEKDIIKTSRVNRGKKTFSITLPPPNITGSLHIGHAFTSTIQDIMLRFKRQQGFVVFGQPGIDHAGIATQIIVEKNLKKEGIKRHEIGREAFIQKVWEWKTVSGGQIFNQLRRLGFSIDWSTSRFTLDDNSNKAVLKAFVELYKAGLIYRDKRMVNWDPILKTAISDLEVTNKIESGKMWYIRYKIDSSTDFVTVATTRPETMFGDTAVAVHPEDPRYQHLIGRTACLPLTDRKIPIIADSYIILEKGTGAMKITPASDFEDFKVGKRHNLQFIEIMNEDATLNENVPSKFQGLSREEARTAVLKELENQGFLEKTETMQHSIPYNERSGCIIEPRITDQWFLNAEELAQPAIKAVEDGKIRFISNQWESTYFEWMRNIQPWCLSRQIWWGHQIPVWYGPKGEVFCAETEEEAKQLASTHFKCSINEIPELQRDPDVLDTWFSSGLWPFSTQYWPEQTEELRTRYPNSMMVTGFDIIFFWIARMIMLGLYFMKDVPFREVYIHQLIRDEKGKKMSKSQGNVIDPLILMDKYGTDAMRFTLANLASVGNDIRLGKTAVENSRNFMTKIWNAAKFLEMNECLCYEELKEILESFNSWILYELTNFKEKVFIDYNTYRFDYVSQNIMKFLKDIFCDVYIEGIKACFLSNNISDIQKNEYRKVAGFVFAEFLKITNPIIPFITEYLWEAFSSKPDEMLLVSEWKDFKIARNDKKLKETLLFVNFTEEIRSIRGLLNIPPTLKLILWVSKEFTDFVTENTHWICPLGKLKEIQVHSGQKALKIVYEGYIFYLEFPQNINESKIHEIIQKKLQELLKDCDLLSNKIKNEAYKEARLDQWQRDKELYSQKQREIKGIKAIG